MLVRIRPVQAGISLLVDQEIGPIHLFKFQIDGLDEECRDVRRGLAPQIHGLGEICSAEFNHDGIGVAIDDFGIVFISILDGKLWLDKLFIFVNTFAFSRSIYLFGLFNHDTSKRGNTTTDRQQGKLSNGSACKSIHTICADL